MLFSEYFLTQTPTFSDIVYIAESIRRK